MGKSLPRKCKACKKTYKTKFVRHAKACTAGFTEWPILNRAGDEIPMEKLKKIPNRIVDATDGVCVGAHADEISDGARAWSKVKRMGVRLCTKADCLDAFEHFFGLMQAHHGIQPRDLKRARKALEAKLEE